MIPRWGRAAELHLRDIGWHRAEVIDVAVQRFARTGRGDVEQPSPGHFVLRVGSYRVWFYVVPGEAGPVMDVAAVYGPRPRPPRRLL
jgi:plasmid stabilization system protein ParE